MGHGSCCASDRGRDLLSRLLVGSRQTLIVGVLALGSGLVLFGFNLWMPSNLRKLGVTNAEVHLIGHLQSNNSAKAA